MNRRTLLFRLGLLGAAVGGGVLLRDRVIWRPPGVSFVSQDWLEWAEPRADTPTANVVVNGQPVRALIDSGAQYSVIDRRFFESLDVAEAFNMPVLAYGVGGMPQLGRGTSLTVQIGGARIDRLQAGILDLGDLALEAGLGTPLILGQDVLGETQLDMDLTHRRRERRRLRILPPDAEVPLGLARLDVRKAGRSLTTPVLVEGTRVEAVVDTGSTSTLALSEGAAKHVGVLDGRPETRGTSLVLGGVMNTRIVEAASLRIGGIDYGPARTPIYPGLPVPGFPRALVGMAAFRHRRVILDLKSARLFSSRPLDLSIG